MTAILAARQRALVDALLGRADASTVGVQGQAGVALERGLLAYSLNAQALAAKSLGAVFGRVQQVLGDDSFAAMAWTFWRRCPPQHGDLGLWGEQLAGFLSEQDGTPSWLRDLARLEWAAHAAERSADSELDAASLALMTEMEPDRLRLIFRPGLQLLQVEAEAWQAWSGAVSAAPVLSLVIARQAWRAEAHAVSAGDWALMSELHGGADLQQALTQALVAQADFDFSTWLQTALLKGWLLAAELRHK